jgi:hypothetical protein
MSQLERPLAPVRAGDSQENLPTGNTWLQEFKSNVYSQYGEDGVIGKILELVSPVDRWCVEFGAWDGKHLSNTRDLIEHHGYSAVLIEGSTSRFQELRHNYSGNDRVFPFNQFVGFGKTDNLDVLLAKAPIPEDFDFLSIDIDGNDYHVWKATTAYRPKVVCIEFNPTIPTEVSFVQPADPNVSWGSSLRSLVELGKTKGYELVSVLRCNALFVRAEHFPRFHILDNRPEALRASFDEVTYIFSLHDGTVCLAGCQKLPWHDLELKASRVNVIPRFLRKHPSDYSNVERLLFHLFTSSGFGDLWRRVQAWWKGRRSRIRT